MYEREYFLYWGTCTVVVAAVMVTLGAMGVLPMECGPKEPDENGKQPVVTNPDSIVLPPRTNTGDTLYVLGKAKGKKRVYAMQPNGKIDEFKFQGVDRVKPGDTIIINMKHKFLMKNISQRNLEKQK